MKLSELIRKGAAVTGPLTNDYVRFRDDGVCACALGAAYLGATIEGDVALTVDEAAHRFRAAEEVASDGAPWRNVLADYDERFVIVDEMLSKDAPRELVERLATEDIHVGCLGVGSIVVDLNDVRGWKREKIADLLAEQGL